MYFTRFTLLAESQAPFPSHKVPSAIRICESACLDVFSVGPDRILCPGRHAHGHRVVDEVPRITGYREMRPDARNCISDPCQPVTVIVAVHPHGTGSPATGGVFHHARGLSRLWASRPSGMPTLLPSSRLTRLSLLAWFLLVHLNFLRYSYHIMTPSSQGGGTRAHPDPQTHRLTDTHTHL